MPRGIVNDSFDDRRLAEALRTGEPDRLRPAFDRHIDAMTLLARSLSGVSDAAADRLITAAWTSVTSDFERDQPRGSARAWLFARLARLDPTVETGTLDDDGPDDVEFLPADDPWEGHWVDFPAPWRAAPDAWESSSAGRAAIEATVGALPIGEQILLILRDVDGWAPSEVGALTGLLPDEEREMLFRARLKIRDVMDSALRTEPSPVPADEAAKAARSARAPRQEPAAMSESPDLTCQVSVALLPKYLDDDLPENQTVRLEQHIAICRGCRTYLEQLRRTIAAVSRLRTGESRHQLWVDIAACLSASVISAAPATPDDSATGNPPTVDPGLATSGTDPSDRVIAYKFLASDRTACFSQVRWPLPDADDAWILASAAVGTCRRAVHACRMNDLAYWLDQQLWRVELVGKVTESATKIVAERGRLLEPVDDWPEVVPAFIDDCTARLAELRDWAEEKRDLRSTHILRAYLTELAEDTEPASVSYAVAHAAGIVGWLPGEGLTAKARGEPTPFDTERRRQGRWLAARLGLTD
jgi:RNA polymerase sigma-70 factor, ECF subfamily